MSNKKTILLVEFDPKILEEEFEKLKASYVVLKTRSHEEAVEIIEKGGIDLIILDEMTPKIKGFELFSTSSEKGEGTKILLTGYKDLALALEIVNKGELDKHDLGTLDSTHITEIVLFIVSKKLLRAVDEEDLLQRQLIQSSKLASLGELAAGIAHELNNPLSFILSNLGNLNKFFTKINNLIEYYDEFDLSADTKEKIVKKQEEIKYSYLKDRIIEMVDKSKTGALRMRKIIMDIKSFARIDTDEIEESDINESIDTTLSILTNELKNRVEIKKEFADIPFVNCYIGKINQVFMNLIVNASHAIDGSGVITIKTSREGPMVSVAISDNGKGIPHELLDKIFDPFYTTKPVGIGTGLGLSICNDIVKKHKGEIFLDSKVDVGTTFTVTLPIEYSG